MRNKFGSAGADYFTKGGFKGGEGEYQTEIGT